MDLASRSEAKRSSALAVVVAIAFYAGYRTGAGAGAHARHAALPYARALTAAS